MNDQCSYKLIETIDFPSQNQQYLHQFSIFLNADLTIEFSSVRASKWAIHCSIILGVGDFDQKFYKVLDEIIIFYRKLIHFLDNIDFADNFWPKPPTPNIIEWWIAHFEALTELNSMVKSAFKNIENWWRYCWFCDGKSIVCMGVDHSTMNISTNTRPILTGVRSLDSSH